MMAGRLRPLWGVLLGAVLLAAAYVAPDFSDAPWLTGLMLKADLKRPQLISFHTEEVVRAVRSGLLGAAGAALAGYLLWVLAVLLGRPTGPGQVARSWRWGVWWLLGVLALAGSGLLTYVLLTVQHDTIDPAAATKFAVLTAGLAAAAYWALSLLGAERMLLPAVPAGRWLVPAR